MGNLAEHGGRALGSPGHDQVLDALRRILDSTDFIASERNRRFLSYVVLETLAGRADRLKGYTVAVQVFGRDAAFDAQTHPLVRIEAARLRQSLERYYLTGGKSDTIRISIPKGGYVPVFERVAPASPLAVEPEPLPETPPDVPMKRAPHRRALAVPIAAITASLVIAAVAFAINYTDERTISGQSPQATAIGPSVLIQSFASIDGNATENQFAAGLTQELSAALARFKSIQVVDKAGEASGSADRRPSHYNYVVRGSVRRIGDTARVLVQLEDGSTKALLWTRMYDRMTDQPGFVDAQHDIAAKVAATLGDPYDVLFSNEAKRITAGSAAAGDPYACVFRFYAYLRGPRAAEHRALRDCHERTVNELPFYAEAWTDLAWLYLDEFRYDYNVANDKRPALDRAADAAFHAASLQPDSARAHLMMAMVHWFRREQAAFEKHADLALALNENDTAVAAELGLRFAMRGDWERGRELIDRVLARDPVRWQGYRLAYALHAVEIGDYRAALDEIGRPKPGGHPAVAAMRAAVYGLLDRTEEAREEWRIVDLDIRNLAEAPRAWFVARGMSDDLVCRLMHGLDKAGLLSDD